MTPHPPEPVILALRLCLSFGPWRWTDGSEPTDEHHVSQLPQAPPTPHNKHLQVSLHKTLSRFAPERNRLILSGSLDPAGFEGWTQREADSWKVFDYFHLVMQSGGPVRFRTGFVRSKCNGSKPQAKRRRASLVWTEGPSPHRQGRFRVLETSSVD